MAFIEEEEAVSAVTGTNELVLDSTDDVDLADRMRDGREKILSEIRKLIIGQEKKSWEIRSLSF